MDAAFRAWGQGEVAQPVRSVLTMKSGAFFVMPAATATVAGVKALTYLPGNAGTDRPVIQGLVTLFDSVTGDPAAILDAASLTAIRTAAASGLATRYMARADAPVIAILGSGIQARTHLEAMLAVRNVREIRVWSRTAARAASFARSVADLHQSVRACDSAQAAVHGADIVCCVTSASMPIIASGDLASGAHVNAVGAHTRNSRELDGATVARSRFIVDSIDAARAECGELALAVSEGACTESHVAGELASVVLGAIPGRTSERELTVFKSLGLAVEDVYAAQAVFEAAQHAPDAQWVTL